MQTLLDAMTGSAAILKNDRSDILAANQRLLPQVKSGDALPMIMR